MDWKKSVGQLFFIGIPGPELDASTRELLSEVQPGGVCLFARNIRSAVQTRELLEGLRELLPAEPLLSVDQEGGLVDRLRRIAAPMPAPSKLRSPADAARLGSLIASALRILGFNMNFAPVVDVIDAGRDGVQNGLQTRNLGASREDVVDHAAAFLSALEAGGILGCLKHFPGLGASAVDSHDELPSVEITYDELESVDLFPYRELLRSDPSLSVMIAHAAYPNTGLQETDQNGKLLPSSLSSSVVSGLLRNTLGFTGLTITDDLEMGAIVRNYGIGEASKMALNAGVDMLAICADPEAIREGFAAVSAAAATGEISAERFESSLLRIERHREFLSTPVEFDESALDLLSDEIKRFAADLDKER